MKYISSITYFKRYPHGIKLIILLLLISFCNMQYAQDRVSAIRQKLEALAETVPNLNSLVSFTVSNESIQELVRGVGVANEVNIDIEPSLTYKVTNSFTDVKVIDVIVYLCRQFDLEIEITGTIITIKQQKKEEVVEEKTINIEYSKVANSLTIDLQGEKLKDVFRTITDKTGKNFIYPQKIKDTQLSAYIKNMSFDRALTNLAEINNLSIVKSDNGTYSIEQQGQAPSASSSRKTLTQGFNKVQKGEKNKEEPTFKISVAQDSSITLVANNSPLDTIIRAISKKLDKGYYLVDKIDKSITIDVGNISYEPLMDYILEGTDFTVKKQGNVYFFGNKETMKLKTTQLIKLNYRPVNRIDSIIPELLKANLDIVPSLEMNSLFVSGPEIYIKQLRDFIKQIDVIIPLIQIDVILVDVNDNRSISTGISAGVGEEPAVPGGSIHPGIDFTLSTKAINSLFKNIQGLGLSNLGKVTPNFYLTIKALEDNGLVTIRSTPKLTTLNGHSAKLTSGETKYYKEERQNYYGSLNPQMSNSYEWKPIDANLEVTIEPVVSGDEHITLSLTVKQTQFTPREYEDAPPGSVNREFQALIRVKNEEMVLLGGLERNTSSSTNSGVPVLSRIPILKWIFGNQSKTKTDSKLNIFIKPTVIY